ncbi:MAG: LPS biosynthesis-modulating metalloenzyme YejM [Symbiopectobacterium sp.]
MVSNRHNYREKASQMISWGHWFALCNILLSLGVGSRYLFVADWPSSLLGRSYAILSWLGHFSFIVFAVYLLIVFPLTFVVMSQRFLRFLSAALATTGLTLLLLDMEVFSRFHLHLNLTVWELVITPEQSDLAREWQLMFIGIPVIFMVEILFSTWCWKKLRSLNRHSIGMPVAAVFISTFFASHMMYIWADANFYRPITMQRATLPLSYPMTARRFLEKHGLLDAQAYERRITLQGSPEAITLEYPLNNIQFRNAGSGYNLLIVVADQLPLTRMPQLMRFAEENVHFSNHFNVSQNAQSSLFNLFYGISTTYMDGVLSARTPSALVSSLNQQGYQFGLFSSNGFDNPLYRQALLSDFSLSVPVIQRDVDTVQQWQAWLETGTQTTSPWFSYIELGITGTRALTDAKDTDQNISAILNTLQSQGKLDNTVVIITAKSSEQDKGSHYRRSQWQIPLVVHWPGTPAQTISKMTDQKDVMVTLMQRLLHVKTSTTDYAQGEDLFAAQRRNNWLVNGNHGALMITTPEQIIQLEANGSYDSYNSDGEKLRDEKPSLPLLLQILTNERRFIAN